MKIRTARHAQPTEPEERHDFLGTLRLLLRQPLAFIMILLAVLTAVSILAVYIGNKYGDTWGAIVGTLVVPLIAGRMLKQRARRPPSR
jgi:hypothetical protein